MIGSEVQFIGGPADGRCFVLRDDPPPRHLEVPVEPEGPWYGFRDDESAIPRRALYERRVSMDLSGPRWLYDHVSTC